MSITINVDDIVDLLEVRKTNTGVGYSNADIEVSIVEQYKELVRVNSPTHEVKFIYVGVSFTETVHSEHELISAWQRVCTNVQAV